MSMLLHALGVFVAGYGLAISSHRIIKHRSSVGFMGLLLLGVGLFVFSALELTSSMMGFWLLFAIDMLLLGIVSLLFSSVARFVPRFFWPFSLLFLFLLTSGANVAAFKLKNFDGRFDVATETITTFDLDQTAELLVQFKEGVVPSTLGDFNVANELRWRTPFTPLDDGATSLDDMYALDVDVEDLTQLNSLVVALEAHPDILYVEGNEIVQLDDPTTVSVQRIGRGYGLNDAYIERLWSFEAMKMSDWYVYAAGRGLRPKKQAKIAILDTGVDGSHEDIRARFTGTKGEKNIDRQGHGTHCAGIAAAVTNNTIGIASVAPTNNFVQVTSIKVLSDGGMGTQQAIISGMLKAADTGADVISMSLGARASGSKTRAYKKAVEYANKKGAIVVVAAGNSNRNAKDYAPANTPGVITVSAIDNELQRAAFSNYISDVKMGIAAPGVDIFSTKPDNKYAAHSGTSMATPYVAGLLGMMKSLRPNLDTKTAYEILSTSGATTKSDKETGKLIQPTAAIKQLLKD